MKHVERTKYLQRLLDLRCTPDIKIITGMRRSGKSDLMKSYMEQCKLVDANCNIIAIDFTDLGFEKLKEYHALYQYVIEHYQKDKTNYLFIDEVQLCAHFELAINSLYAKQQYDIYLTGSNAFLLSADLATLFTGRYIELHVLPFSFQEYYEYNDEKHDIDALFANYVREGGFAGSYVYRTEFDRNEYLRNVYTTVMHRDLQEKYNILDMQTLDMLAEFLLDNVGNLTSINKIAATLANNRIATNHVTVGCYVKYLCHAFMFYKLKRYDIKGKKYLETSDKYYAVDNGLRYAILGTRNMDYGRIYENIVALELLRRGYDVYVGKLYAKEIDFVVQRGNEKFYIQVSDDISTSTTLEREIEPLLKIRDAYPKIVLANTKHEAYQYEGIRIYDIARWLLAM